MRSSDSTDDIVITEQDSSSPLLWSFLEYLCAYHKRKVGRNELIAALFADSCNDPIYSLKNLLHRGRALLEKLGFPDGTKVLRQQRGMYYWDPSVELKVDMDQFDALCDQFYEQADGGVEYGLQAVQLYQEDFLFHSAGDAWSISLQAYYRTKYLRLCYDVASALRQLNRYREAIELCRNAAARDPYDEKCQILLMHVLYESGAVRAAIQYYHQTSKLLIDQMGVNPSEEMTEFYRKICRTGQPREMDLNIIRDGLKEENPYNGAFFCDYQTFRFVYQLNTRSMERNGPSIELGLITILSHNGDSLTAERLSLAMEELSRSIVSCLRCGDVYTKFSQDQYLVLLMSTSYENAEAAIKRVMRFYQNTLIGKTTLFQFSLLDAAPSNIGENLFGFRKLS